MQKVKIEQGNNKEMEQDFEGASQPTPSQSDLNEPEFVCKDDKQKLILCDFNGTLSGLKNGVAFNDDLLIYLARLKEQGFRVFICSDDAQANQTSLELKSKMLLGDKDFFGWIEPKSSFADREALLIIDDDPITVRHINYTHLWDPNDEQLKIDIKESIAPPQTVVQHLELKCAA